MRYLTVITSGILLTFTQIPGNASNADSFDGPAPGTGKYIRLADNDDREDRRDERGRSDERQDKRDCRQEEGAVGKDKRDCKQEEVRDGVRGNR
jgi:hypothetical protein